MSTMISATETHWSTLNEVKFLFESDDPGPAYLHIAMVKVAGNQLASLRLWSLGWSTHNCVKDAATVADYDREHLGLLLSGNALPSWRSPAPISAR